MSYLLLAAGLLGVGLWIVKKHLARQQFRQWRADHERRVWSRGIEDQVCWKWPGE